MRLSVIVMSEDMVSVAPGISTTRFGTVWSAAGREMVALVVPLNVTVSIPVIDVATDRLPVNSTLFPPKSRPPDVSVMLPGILRSVARTAPPVPFTFKSKDPDVVPLTVIVCVVDPFNVTEGELEPEAVNVPLTVKSPAICRSGVPFAAARSKEPAV